MVQILPYVQRESFRSQLGRNVGEGLGKGVETGVSTFIKSIGEKRKKSSKIDAAVQKSFGSDWDTMPDEEKIESIASARNLFEKGDSFENAILKTRYPDQFKDQGKKFSQSVMPRVKEKSFLERLGGRDETIDVLKNTYQDLKSAGQKFLYPFVQQADLVKEVFDPRNAAELDMLQQGFTPEEIEQSREEIQPFLPGFLRQDKNKKSLTEKYLEVTGGKGPGENKVERMVQGALGAYHPAGAAGTFAKEAAEELGAPAPVQAAADALAFVLAIKSGPKIKNAAFEANERFLSNAEKVSASTGQKVEEVVAKAQQESGANLEEALAGNKSEIDKLNRRISKELPAGADKISQTEKKVFNHQQALKEREIFNSRLPESPLEEYFSIRDKEISKNASKRPETLANEAEIASRVKPLEEAKYREYQEQKRQLSDLQKEMRNGQGNNLERLQSASVLKQRQIKNTLEELKDLQYELKYFRKRPTEAEIDAQIQRSSHEFINEAKNPTPEGQKKIMETLNKDREYIQRAQKLIERGELPGELRPDTHIKMKQKYLEGYKGVINELKEMNRSLRGARDSESLKKIADNKKSMEYLKNRIDRLNADIVNQTDNIKAMRALEGPSGAFYRNQLKDLRKDLERFQHDFFREIKNIKSPTQVKTGNTAISKLETFAEKTGIPKEEIRKEVDSLAKEAEKTAQTATEKDFISSMGKKIEETATQAAKKSIKSGFRNWLERSGKRALGNLLEKSVLYAVTGGSAVSLYQLYQTIKFGHESNKYKNSTPEERKHVILEWKAKGYNTAKIKRIINSAKAKEELN